MVIMEVGSILISIHPPRAGRDDDINRICPARCISIHPPRAGRDDYPDAFIWTKEIFQSTRPVRGGTLFREALPPQV